MYRENVFVDKEVFFIYNCVCNNLIKEGLLEKHREKNSKKEIYYCITDAGLQVITEKFKNSEKTLEKLRNKTRIRKTAQDLAKMF